MEKIDDGIEHETIRHATCMLQWRKDWRVAEALDSTEIVAYTREMERQKEKEGPQRPNASD